MTYAWALVPEVWFSSKGMHKKCKHCLTAKKPLLFQAQIVRASTLPSMLHLPGMKRFHESANLDLEIYLRDSLSSCLRHVNFLVFPSFLRISGCCNKTAVQLNSAHGYLCSLQLTSSRTYSPLFRALTVSTQRK